MLSVENPPPDPSSTSSDEKKVSSDKQQQQQQQLPLVDLLKSDLDVNKINFSIRDYVFNTRSKDLKNNWPFSQENLQLCLKHGVTDLLPPFQSPDQLRNPSLESYKTDISLLSEKQNTSILNGEPTGRSDHHRDCSNNTGCNPKLADQDCSDTSPSGSGGDKELPSTITSQSCSVIDSVPTNKSPSFELETDILPEISVAKPQVVSSASSKTQKTTQVPTKKCRLIVKLSNVANSSAKEDNSLLNNFMVSEAMASKVCPVCKTFSSSSNTTLNAHIDQCLSGASTTKCTTDSKVIKHKIKPRKMKSMVEICATALPCTLEELDRRNGTNWATNSILPAQEIATSADREKERPSPTDLEETPDEGAVYIDASGTKVRILSKSNSLSVFSKVVNRQLPKKSINRDKVQKILGAKKKKQNQVQKQHKLLKHSKNISSQSLHSSKVNGYQDRNFSEDEGLEKEDCLRQQIKGQSQDQFSRPDMIQGWACSKRTGLVKKSRNRDDHQHSGSWDDEYLAADDNQLSLRGSRVKKRSERCTENVFENPLPSPTSSNRIDISSHDHLEEYMERPSLRKRPGLSLVPTHASHDRKRSKELPKYPDCNVKRRKSNEDHNQEDHVSLQSNRKMKMSAGQSRKAGDPVVNPKVSADHWALISKARRFSSLRRKLTAGQKAMFLPKYNSKGKCPPFKKSREHCMSESDEEAACAVDRRHMMQNSVGSGVRVERTCDLEPVDGNGILKIRKSGGGSMVSRKEETMALKTSNSVSMSHHYDAGDPGSSVKLVDLVAGKSGVVETTEEEIHHGHAENLDTEPSSEDAPERTFTDFRKSLDAGLHGLAGTSDAQHDSHCFTDVYRKPPHFESEAPASSAEPILSGGQEIFSAAEVPAHMIREDVHMMVEPESSDGQGNYYSEVDPIPIPGPPGSFLPSPGHMDSEDLQGNSSLTSSRVQSSDDHQELVDQSSGSPVSATSTISNSNLARSDLKSTGKLCVGYSSFLHEMGSGSISSANIDPGLESSLPALEPNDAGEGRSSLEDRKVNSPIKENGSFRYRSDQPCCCSRKEGFAQIDSLHNQESQLLRRRSMTPVIVAAGGGKEMTGDTERRLDSLRSKISSTSGLSTGLEAAIESPMGHSMSRNSAESEFKFSSRDDGESYSPSSSNPVLRLMGKNLMVVKKEDSICPQLKPSQFSSLIGHTHPPVVPLSGVCIGNVWNDNQHIGHHMVPQGPFYIHQEESRKQVIQFPHELRWSDGFGSRASTGTPQLPPLGSPASLANRGAAVEGGILGTLMHHDYMAGHHLPMEQRQPQHKLEPAIIHDDDKFVGSPNPRWRNAKTTPTNIKEIIVIDDAPENEVDSTFATHSEGMMIHGVGSSFAGGRSMATAIPLVRAPRHEGTFHNYHQFEPATLGEPPVDASFWMPPAAAPSGVNRGAVTWNWSLQQAEGSNSLQAISPLVMATSAAAQQRSKLYSSSTFQ